MSAALSAAACLLLLGRTTALLTPRRTVRMSAGGWLRKAADMVGGSAAASGPAVLGDAPSWGALAERLAAAETVEEAGAAALVAAGRGPPTAGAALRLFDAPDGYEPRVTLYRDSASWCPYCQKIWMQLEEKRIPYRVERINMRCYGSKPAWFEREAGGLLPVVRLDGDLVLDSVSILFALEGAFPEAESLLPPGGRAAIADLVALEKQFAGAWLGWLRAPAALSAGARANFEATLGRVDGALSSTTGGFFLGADLSLVDLLFVSFLERAEASLLFYKGFRVRDGARFPGIAAWFDAMETRPSFRASASDYYTHAMDLPPQLGGCGADGAGEVFRDALAGGEWTLGALAAPPLQPLPAASGDAGAARRAAARKLVANHEKVAVFACRAHGPPGVPPVAAPLADPNNASPVRWHIGDVDAALRHVADALLGGGGDPAPRTLAVDGADAAPTAAALRYLRDRVGVPRDMDYAAARQFRAHLTWAIDGL